MPVECKEEVLPPNTLPSYGGIAELHFAVSVIVLESKNKINCTTLVCMNVSILKLSRHIHYNYPSLLHTQFLHRSIPLT